MYRLSEASQAKNVNISNFLRIAVSGPARCPGTGRQGLKGRGGPAPKYFTDSQPRGNQPTACRHSAEWPTPVPACITSSRPARRACRRTGPNVAAWAAEPTPSSGASTRPSRNRFVRRATLCGGSHCRRPRQASRVSCCRRGSGRIRLLHRPQHTRYQESGQNGQVGLGRRCVDRRPRQKIPSIFEKMTCVFYISEYKL